MQPISVIIPVRNEGARIIQTVLSIVTGRSQPFPLEIIIVDDASSDAACSFIEKTISRAPEVKFILHRLKQWSGIPFSRNRGADIATYPIYLITDGNTTYPPNWDLPIWRNFARQRLLAGTIVDIESPESFRGYGCSLSLPSMSAKWLPVIRKYGEQVLVSACTCTVIDGSLFHHLGGYDESLPLYGAAEPEFSVRAWLSGYEIINVPDLLVAHRFRPRDDHATFRASFSDVLIRGYLRFACYYLPEELLVRTCQYYECAAPNEFNTYRSELQEVALAARREYLKNYLPLGFSWLARKFSLASQY